jgi:hypothetical protein
MLRKCVCKHVLCGELATATAAALRQRCKVPSSWAMDLCRRLQLGTLPNHTQHCAVLNFAPSSRLVCVGLEIRVLRRRGQRPGHHDQVPARRRGDRPGHHDQVPPTHNERRRKQRPGTTIKFFVNQNAGACSNWAKAHIHKSWNEFRRIYL